MNQPNPEEINPEETLPANTTPVKTKGRKAEKYRAVECLNCGHPLDLTDRYCSYCSQMNTTKHLSLKDFFGEFVSSIITYDSRFRYTIKDLLFKPGTISRNYVRGKRLKYANPFRFFLSVSIIYFIIQGLVSTFTGQDNVFNSNQSINGNTNVQTAEFGPTGDNFKIMKTTDLDSLQNQADVQGTLNQVDSILKDKNIQTGLDQVNLADLDSVIKSRKSPRERERDSLKDILGYKYYTEAELDSLSWGNRWFQRFMLYRDFYKATEISDPETALDSLKHTATGYNKWAYGKNSAFEKIEKNPRDFFNYLLEKTPFFVFLFAPVYAFFFWLIYSKKKYTYMEHMVLIFHIFSFIFLASLIAILPDTILGDGYVSGVIFGLIGPFYFYKALRNFYKQNRLITIIKFIFLNWVFWISATVTAVAFFAVTAAMY